MLLHWGTEYLEKVLPPHLQARMKEIRCDPHLDLSSDIPPVPFVNALTGQLMAEFPQVGVRVSRKKLRRFFTDGENLNIKVRTIFQGNFMVGKRRR
jgi:hypothetical protein